MKNLKTSILGFDYHQKEIDERHTKAISQRFGLSEILSNLIAQRNLALDEVENFLDPKIKNLLPNPFELDQMREAVDHIIEAIRKNKKITLFADYDVDGATSSAMLKRFFRDIGFETEIYIPDRILEGYGPNSAALLKLKQQGTDLVITLDCGTVAFEPLKDAAKAGLEIIVIDHHIGVVEKPKSIAVVNPNSFGEKFTHKNLCAAGVTFLLVVAINKTLREQNFYQNIKEPNLFDLLDLAALGTICDVMSLTNFNRAIVSAGLKVIKQRKNLGIRSICDMAKIDQEINSYHLGFIIGPRINASGRIAISDLGAKILASDNEDETKEIAKKLEDFNIERRNIEATSLQEAIEMLESKEGDFSKNDSVIFAASKNWHQGIIGIVASRIKDLYQKPTIIISIDEENQKGKASCRSIAGVDLGAEILNAKFNNLIIEGGGHAMAAGFSIEVSKIKDLHNYFCQKLAAKVEELTSKKIQNYDLAIDSSQLNIDLIKEINRLEPFGVGNPRPKFLIKNLVKIKASLVGADKKHLSILFGSKSQIGFSNSFSAIMFAANEKISEIIMAEKFSQIVDVIGVVNINHYLGKEKISIQIEDILI